MSEPKRTRMFPLGTVLVPTGPLPLHIFEQRYQQLLNESLEDDRTFGVVLISRGSEVGGGDTRTAVGTRATIIEHQRFDDGRAAVIAEGTSRIEVVEWLDDDPFPVALTIERPDAPTPADFADKLGECQQALASLFATANELGRLDELPTFDWHDDHTTAAWQLCVRAPISELDRQAVLAADAPGERVTMLHQAIDDIADDLRLMGRLG